MERLGRNELISKIGQGGMAEVYLAQASLAQGLQKLVVVKKIHAAFSRSHHFARMFRSEASMATQLNHPNIVQVFDYGKEGDEHYLVMEYVEGLDLMRMSKLATQAGLRVPHGIGVFIVQELLKGLDYAHRKTGPAGEPLDIVHRDVSPQNVLISTDGAVKLVDFGIAKTRTEVEEEGVVKGKYAYMSPEQASGLSVDRRCDVFAAGIILYELLTGDTLFGRFKGEEILKAVRAAVVAPPSTVDPTVPKALEPIILRALARRVEDRFATARDFQHALTRFLYAQDEIYDTAALATFIARILPGQDRLAGQDVVAPVTAMASPGRPGTVGSGSFEDSDASGGPTGRGGSAIFTERKKVLLVCGQLGIPEDMDAAGRRQWEAAARSFSRVAGDIVFKYEGVLGASDADRVTAMVGLPVATEEDASRAIDLTRALLDAFGATCEDFGVTARLGCSITRGSAVVERQPDEGFRYEISANLQHLGLLAAASAGPGEILVDDHVRRASQEEWEFQEQPALGELLRQAEEEIAKGADAGSTSLSARLFRLLGPAEPQESSAVLDGRAIVGRALEMKALADTFWDMRRQWAGRVVVIYGDKGMGKRTLVRSFLGRLAHWEGQVLRMVARQVNQISVHGTLSEIATQLLCQGEQLARPVIAERIREIAGQLPQALASNVEREFVMPLEVLLGLGDQAALAGRDPGELNREIQEALYRLLAWRSARSPLVLILENAHIAGRLTLTHIGELARRLRSSPILAILTSRPLRDGEELLPGVKGLAIHLGELGPDERLELAQGHFVDAEEAGPLIKQVLDRAGGNPFYIEAIVDSLVEQGVCSRDAQDPQGRLRLARKDAQVQIPATVESLVASRLDRLPPELRGLLRAASVFGRVFEGAHLEALLGESVAASLAELERRHLVFPLAGVHDRWSFAQVVIQEVAYSGLEVEVAADMHRMAAEVLLSDARYRPGASDARVARQLELGGAVEEAVQRYVAAARYARNVSGNREAFQLLTLALESGVRDPRVLFEIHKEREQILRGWGRRSKQLEEITRMRVLAEEAEDPGLRATALMRRLRHEQDGGHPKRVLDRFDSAMAAAVAAGDALLQADALRLRARALNDLGQNDEALVAVEKALRLLPKEQGSLRLRGELLHTQGNIRFYTGQPAEAVGSYAEALSYFRKGGHKRLEGTMLMNIGFVSQAMGDYEGALKYYQESYNIDLQIGDRLYTGAKLANIGQAYAEIGQYDRAEKYLRKALDLCQTVEDVSGVGDVLTTLGQIRLWQGNVDSARKKLLEGVRLSRESENAYGEMRAQIYLGFARLEAGEPPDLALEEGEQATLLSRRSNMPQGVVFGLMLQAEALKAQRRFDEGLARSAEAMAVVATGTPIVGVEEALCTHAELLHLMGRTSEARPFMQRGLDEILKKARRFRQPERQRSFLAGRVIRRILDSYTQIVGPLGDELRL